MTLPAAYRELSELARGCAIEAGLIANLADCECPHGHLPTDRRITCACWNTVSAPDLMVVLSDSERTAREGLRPPVAA